MNCLLQKKKDAGFTLVELIIVIAIMAILAGIMAPAMVHFVKKARHNTDINTAYEIKQAFERSIAQYDPGTSVSGLNWAYTGAVAWNCNSNFSRGGTGDILQYVFCEVEKLPVSATNKNWFWLVIYDGESGIVNKIYLTPSLNSSTKYELYPDSTAFEKLKK